MGTHPIFESDFDCLTENGYHVEGYAGWTAFVQENKGKEIFALFCGGKDASGKSWCPDCATAEPVVHGELEKLPKGSVFVHVDVGGRDYWKNKENDFRVDPQLKLTGVPTLLKLGEKAKLVEDQLFKSDLIQMLFEE